MLAGKLVAIELKRQTAPEASNCLQDGIFCSCPF